MQCGLCDFLIIEPQIALYHVVWCGAVQCTITCGAVRLCHFACSISAVFTVCVVYTVW